MAQWWFAAAYLLNQFVVMRVYIATQAVPPWTLLLLSVSKRMHSIFLLRLFNDGITMLLANLAILFLVQRRWRLSLLLFSAALSVKMNVLLLAPPVAIILLQVSLPILFLLSQPCAVCECTFPTHVVVHGAFMCMVQCRDAGCSSRKLACPKGA